MPRQPLEYRLIEKLDESLACQTAGPLGPSFHWGLSDLCHAQVLADRVAADQDVS